MPEGIAFLKLKIDNRKMAKKIIIALIIVFIFGAVAVFYILEKDIPPKEMYRIGLLEMGPVMAENTKGFKSGMADLGFREGENVEYIYRDGKGDIGLIAKYAVELAKMKPDLIFVNGDSAVAAVKEASRETGVPVVFSMVADPLRAGFIESIRSSGNNLTGTSCNYIEIAFLRLSLLKEIDPSIEKVLVFYRPEDLSGGPAARELLGRAPEIGIEIRPIAIEKKEDVSNYLAQLKPKEVDAIIDPADFTVRAGLIEGGMEKAKELNVPLFMLSEEECRMGALASFGAGYGDLGKQSSSLAGQILIGVQPTDIPIENPRRFFFCVNQKRAEELGLEVPKEVLFKADIIIR